MTAQARHSEVKERLMALYDELFAHDGYGELRLEIRILKRGQKEVILHCGKQYRYVVDYRPAFSAHGREALPAPEETGSHGSPAEPAGAEDTSPGGSHG